MTRNRMTPEETGGEPDQAERETTAQEIVHDDGDGGGRRHLAETLHGLRGLEVMEREAARHDVSSAPAAWQRGRVALDQ